MTPSGEFKNYLNANGLLINEGKTTVTEFMTKQKQKQDSRDSSRHHDSGNSQQQDRGQTNHRLKYL